MLLNRFLRAQKLAPVLNQQQLRFNSEFLPDKENKAKFVSEVFQNVAPKYDLMNDLMNVAGGTGDIALRFLEKSDKSSKATICDINEHMINEGQRKYPANERLDWVVGDAMGLPFEDEFFDAYTIAYGIRNVADIPSALDEAHRVLKPGGIFMCLEFSQVKNPLLRPAYEKYLLEILPVMGEVVLGDYKSYRYLAESILDFPEQEDFRQMIAAAGFKYTTYENLMQGISCIHYGYKRN